MAKIISGKEMKNRLLQKIAFNTRYGRMPKEKIKPNFTYHQGHPAGYTDDLGIIADKDQWVEEQKEGWFSVVDPHDYLAIRDWCKQNLTHGDWCMGIYYVILRHEEDVAWFILRWS